ncbi:hypothetical protein AOR13_3664 [Alteromonas stellipolaris LMG 21856]|nr:hypothetical protein AOR13_3664 [Alteromonas stellipolaris LMG 21856]
MLGKATLPFPTFITLNVIDVLPALSRGLFSPPILHDLY